MSQSLTKRNKPQSLVAKRDLILKFYSLLYKTMGQEINPGLLKQTFDHLHEWHVEAEIEIVKNGTLFEIVNTLTRSDVPEEDQRKLWKFYERVFTPMMHNYQNLDAETFFHAFDLVKKEAEKIKRKNQIALSDKTGTDAGLANALKKVKALPDPNPAKEETPAVRRMSKEDIGDQVLDVIPIASFFRKVTAKYQASRN